MALASLVEERQGFRLDDPGGADEVAELTVEAASRVVGRSLDSERDRELIAEAIGSLDVSRLEESA